MTPKDILGPTLWGATRDVFAAWVHSDEYGSAEAFEHGVPQTAGHSVRELLQGYAQYAAKSATRGAAQGPSLPLLEDFSVPFHRQMRQQYRTSQGATNSLLAMVENNLVKGKLLGLVFEAWLLTSPQANSVQGAERAGPNGGGEASPQKTHPASRETGQTLHRLMERLLEPDVSESLVKELMAIFLEFTSFQVLADFFKQGRNADGFYEVDPAILASEGQLVASKQLKQGDALVHLDVYLSDERLVPGVRHYEWMAQFMAPRDAVPQAIACGMLYAFDENELENAFPGQGPLYALQAHAQHCLPTHQVHVAAFAAQHPTAPSLLRAGAAAFVWKWERRHATERGIGGACLVAALKLLKDEFPGLHALVVDTRARQFLHPEEGDPAAIQVAMQVAREKVENHLRQLELERLTNGPLCPVLVPRAY